MKLGEQIYQLIQAMNTSEKGYFKKYTKIHKQNSNLVLLFEYLSKQESYNHVKVIEEFKDKKFIKSLKITRESLLDTILKSMRSYRHKSSLRAQLNAMLSDIHFLYDKKLISLCQKWIKKGLKLSAENELPHYNLLFHQWEYFLMILSFDYRSDVPLLDFENSSKNILHQIEESIEISILQQRINVLGVMSRGADFELFKQKADALLAHELFKDKTQLKSTSARLSYHSAFAVYYTKFTHDWDAAYEHFQAMEQTFDTANVQNNFFVQNHFSTLTNLLLITGKLKHYEDFEFYLKKLENFEKTYPKFNTGKQIKSRRLVEVQTLSLLHFSNTNQTERGKRLIAQMEYDFDSSKKIESKFLIHTIGFLIMKIHFLEGEYTIALSWLRKLLYGAEPKYSFILYYHFKVLELLLHLELGNREHLISLTRSFYRFIKKKERDFVYEKHLLDFFNAYQKVHSPKLQKELILRLNNQLLGEKEVVGKQLPYFDLLAWVKGKE